MYTKIIRRKPYTILIVKRKNCIVAQINPHNHIFGFFIQDKELFYASDFAHGGDDFGLNPNFVTGDVQGLPTHQFHFQSSKWAFHIVEINICIQKMQWVDF